MSYTCICHPWLHVCYIAWQGILCSTHGAQQKVGSLTSAMVLHYGQGASHRSRIWLFCRASSRMVQQAKSTLLLPEPLFGVSMRNELRRRCNLPLQILLWTSRPQPSPPFSRCIADNVLGPQAGKDSKGCMHKQLLALGTYVPVFFIQLNLLVNVYIVYFITYLLLLIIFIDVQSPHASVMS